ncbi:hypothetical protein [Tritonibacter mobilis]|uniref:hypothetical protein n=1 Tax=Tritonibacter mobilis TaxID=379347 RepID=UPI0008069A69|nr:hypothetical protein [Tritonibacter mobilis]
MEDNMFSLSLNFTAAAQRIKPQSTCGFSTFWMLVFAFAILEDGDRRKKDRQNNLSRPNGPRPF